MLGNVQRAKVTQFPLIQAHAITGHKSQGRTLRRVIVAGLWRKGKHGLNSQLRAAGWFYTAASRATKRIGLEVRSKKLPMDHIAMQRHDIAAEMSRLAVLHAQTRQAAGAPHSDNACVTTAKATARNARRRFKRFLRQQRHGKSKRRRTTHPKKR